jgi:hypothetical protein
MKGRGVRPFVGFMDAAGEPCSKGVRRSPAMATGPSSGAMIGIR